MKLYVIAGVVLMIVPAFLHLQQEPAPQIETLTENGITTVRLTPLKIARRFRDSPLPRELRSEWAQRYLKLVKRKKPQ